MTREDPAREADSGRPAPSAGLGLSGKRFVVLGVANDKSIGWSISRGLVDHGAEVALTYVNEAIERRVRPLAAELGTDQVFKCDVTSDADIAGLVEEVGARWGTIDGLVHSVAFAGREELQNRFCHTSRAGFANALDVSAYSLVALTGAFLPLFSPAASVLTLTYLGATRVVSNYKVMGVAKAALEASVRYLAADVGEAGVRVNAVSAGPIRTLAASGIPRFKELLGEFAERAPLRRAVSAEDVADTSLFYLSPLSRGVTGEVTFVDCGFNVMGL